MNKKYYETNLIDSISCLKKEDYDYSFLQSDPDLLNKLAIVVYDYYSHVTLATAKNRSLISSCDIPFASVANEATLSFLKNIDRILACDSELYMLKLSNIIASNKLIDMVRAWYRSNPSLSKPGYDNDCTNSQRTICHLDEDGWRLIADTVDVENDCLKSEDSLENREDIERIFSYMKKLTAFQAASFLYTRVLTDSANNPLRPRYMAQLIIENGLEEVAKGTFSAVSELFCISNDAFSYMDFSVPMYENERVLADTISKYSFAVSKKLRNYYLKDKRKEDRYNEKLKKR